MDLSPSVNIICITPTVLKTGPAAQTSSTMVIDPINHTWKKKKKKKKKELDS
jgi:hypothetical protein